MKQTDSFKQTPLYKSLEKCKSAFIFIFWFSLAINILIMFLPIYTMQLLDRVLSSGSTETLIMLTIITLSAFVCLALIESCRSFTLLRIGNWIDKNTSPELLKKTITLTSLQGGISSGEVIRDLSTIKAFLTGQGILALFDIPWSLTYLIIMFMINIYAGFIAIAGVAILLGLAIWNEMATKGIVREVNEKYVRNVNDIELATRNSEAVEAMGMMESVIDLWMGRLNETNALQSQASCRSTVIMGITKFCRLTLQVSVIAVGVALTITQQKTVGGIIACSILMGRTLGPFESAIMTWKTLMAARISYIRLQRMQIVVPVREESMRLPEPKGVVQFEKVIFTPFGTNRPTIKGVSFKIEQGEITGVIGPSAAGKSTLAKLLVGVWRPAAGAVRLDGADVYLWNRKYFGQYVGYLPQDVELFNATIKANIARMNPEIDPEQVVKAAKIAGVHEMILSLPQGYDTKIGTGGCVLSGGQRQRVGLARAFYGNIHLLVLDEPNSNLDQSGEQALMLALSYAKKTGITTFITTHKLPLLNITDKILIMQDGNLVGYGPREEIMAKFTKKIDR